MTNKTKRALVPIKSHRVTVYKEPKAEFSDLWMNIFVIGDDSEQRAFAQMFGRLHCTKADSIEEADMVVFTGGDDVNPSLYGELPHSTTAFSATRDKIDLEAYNKCVSLGVPMFGVCRGAQFLHVMNGGKLFQHVDNHYGDHLMHCTKDHEDIMVSSVHHQMCQKNISGGMEVLGDSNVARNRWTSPDTNRSGVMFDVEAYFYRDTCCFGVQGHPEYRGYDEFLKWTAKKIVDLVCHNPDIELTNNHYRMKPSLIETRKIKLKVEELT